MFNNWKIEMKKFTLFNIKWHPIRFIFWIFATKNAFQLKQIALKNCKMQSLGRFLLKIAENSQKRYSQMPLMPWNNSKKTVMKKQVVWTLRAAYPIRLILLIQLEMK